MVINLGNEIVESRVFMWPFLHSIHNFDTVNTETIACDTVKLFHTIPKNICHPGPLYHHSSNAVLRHLLLKDFNISHTYISIFIFIYISTISALLIIV